MEVFSTIFIVPICLAKNVALFCFSRFTLVYFTVHGTLLLYVCTLNLLTNILCFCYLCPTNLNFLEIFYYCYRLDDATMGTNVSIKHLSDAMIKSRSHRKKKRRCHAHKIPTKSALNMRNEPK